MVKLWKSEAALSPFPEELAKEEKKILHERRKAANVQQNKSLLGLALSGGGIRSATCSLGVLQALAEADILRCVDYISTVSGGGYIGAFLGRMYSKGNELDRFEVSGANTSEKVRKLLQDSNSPPIKWLRDNGRYLTPNGAGDIMTGIAAWLRNFLSVHFVMALLLLPLTIAFMEIPLYKIIYFCIGGCVLLTVAYWGVAAFYSNAKCRRTLTAYLGKMLFLTGLLSIVAALFYISNLMYITNLATFFVGISTPFVVGYKIASSFRNIFEKKSGPSSQCIFSLVSIVFFILYILLFFLAMQVIYNHCRYLTWYILIAIGYLAIIVFSLIPYARKQVFLFLNDSSFAPLYQARVARAYLGAANPRRFVGDIDTIVDPNKGDDVGIEDYRPYTEGGPLHLINVTINETVNAHVEHRDRKGMGLCYGPAGISVGVRHHALHKFNDALPKHYLESISTDENVFQVFPKTYDNQFYCESMNLSRWIAISGAAISTGMGSYTSLALSFLFGLFNLRLGQWWDSGISPRIRKGAYTVNNFESFDNALMRFLPIHAHLINEWLGRFHGTARRHWYLTDGGHYENTGAYELIRRRLPYILLCDNGCDPDYSYADLANLVRKVRMDFGAEVKFLHPDDIDEPLQNFMKSMRAGTRGSRKMNSDCFGLAPLQYESNEDNNNSDGYQTPLDHRHALMAKITYANSSEVSFLIVLKPGLSNDEPLDVKNYRRVHNDFPNQSTGDQIFDEAQWESYRALGFHAARSLFVDSSPTNIRDDDK